MSDKRRFSDMDHKSGVSPADHPPYSRLFIVCSKSVTEDDLRKEFGRFGRMEEIWMVKDKQSGEPKGVAYIKYLLTSEAAKALEEMNGKVLSCSERPIKVLIAHSRGEGSKKEPLEEERLLRLFVVCRRDATEKDLEEHFGQFGHVDSIKLVKNRESNENKGFAYIKYSKMSHAALAYEQCDRSYRPKFAEPKPQPSRYQQHDGYEGGSASSYDDRSRSSYKPHGNNLQGGNFMGDLFTKLQVMVSPVVTQEQLWHLFDIAPGLEFCRLFPDYRAKSPNERVMASVSYSSPQQAAYARDKLHGFEYPPGQPLIVRADRGEAPSSGAPAIPPFPLPSNSGGALSKSDIAILAENVKQATALLKAHTTLTGISPATYDPNYCTAKLPPPRNFEENAESPHNDSDARIFVVFNPSIPERYAIKDVFGRFGRILDIFLLSSKNVGYITYPRKECVSEAINALHGHELCGMFMKVMEAEPRRSGSQPEDDRRKRLKMQVDE